MKKLLQSGAALFLVGASAMNHVQAYTTSTDGGLKIKSDDGLYSAQLNARLQYDAVRFDDGRVNDLTSFESQDGSYFRRGYVTVSGKIGDWGYKLENDFAIGVRLKGVRELWISHALAGGEILFGQHKPFRGLEELTSSNELTAMERPFSATAIFGANAERQYQPGIFWRRPLAKDLLLQLSAYNADHGLGTEVGRGVGTANRLSWLLLNTPERKLYLGGSFGYDYFTDKAPGVRSVAYAGRSSAGGNVVAPSLKLIEADEDTGEAFVGLEGAADFGPLHLQSEATVASYEDARGPGKADVVLSYYGQASVFLTGEHKEYQSAKARFGAPHKLMHSWGAFELTARYDSIENTDRSASVGSGVCQAAAAVAIVGAECAAHQYEVGVNYYVTPLTRVMFNLDNGYSEVSDDHTQSYNVRMQIAF